MKTLKVYCDVLTVTREVSGGQGCVLAARISRRPRQRRPAGRKCCQTAINTDEDGGGNTPNEAKGIVLWKHWKYHALEGVCVCV